MRYFSTFTGIGGFEIGIDKAFQRKAGIQPERQMDVLQPRGDSADSDSLLRNGRWTRPICVGYSEIDKYAIKVYEKQFPGVKNYGDITKINAEELPDFDCLVGGFPCQAFSIAGKRRGFEDTRGTLFFDLARILREKQPRYFVFENVKGLLSHDQGNTFRTIITTIDELGYDCQWSVLNSKNFGVPQNRERVYIVGHLRGTPRPEVFPLASDNGETANEVTDKGQLVDLTRREPNNYRERKDGRAGTLDANYYKGLANQERPGVLIPEATKKGYAEATPGQAINLSVPNSKTRRGRVSDIAPTLDTGMQIHTLATIKNPLKGKTEYGWHFEQNVYDKDGLTRTVKAGGGSGNTLKVIDDVRIRRLTPIETERLQGFPDNWTKYGIESVDYSYIKKPEQILFKISDTQRYKMCGNAVTTNVVQAVFEQIFKEVGR